ncbi:MAG: hypothetical protein IMZ71_03090 [Chloroflexi bacterium]|nr:hypothetical protein [Chloroflexota bacterium]
MNSRTSVVPKSDNWDDNLAAPAGTVLTLVSMLVPARAKFVLKGFGNYLSVVANFGLLRWDFFKNGIPVYPYFAIRTQMGYAAQTRPIEPIVIEGGCLLEIRVTQESGVACVAGVSLDWEEHFGG